MAQQATDIFAELETVYAEMERFLQEEREHLLVPDWDALTEDQKRRQQLTEALSRADARRRELGSQLGLGPEATFADLLPDAEGEPWSQRRAALRDRVARVQEVNRENARLIQAALERNERLLNWLVGSNQPSAGAYDATGARSSGRATTGVMNTKV
jgi:flagellar biosynthesis/type III secretory pathway chaperone